MGIRVVPTKKAAKRKSVSKGTPKEMPMMAHQEDTWQAENDLRTLIQAEEIKRDSRRLAKARAVAKTQVTAISKVTKGGK
jgi:hypothetical protein